MIFYVKERVFSNITPVEEVTSRRFLKRFAIFIVKVFYQNTLAIDFFPLHKGDTPPSGWSNRFWNSLENRGMFVYYWTKPVGIIYIRLDIKKVSLDFTWIRSEQFNSPNFHLKTNLCDWICSLLCAWKNEAFVYDF